MWACAYARTQTTYVCICVCVCVWTIIRIGEASASERQQDRRRPKRNTVSQWRRLVCKSNTLYNQSSDMHKHKCTHMMGGGERTRSLSLGEKKRCSIASIPSSSSTIFTPPGTQRRTSSTNCRPSSAADISGARMSDSIAGNTPSDTTCSVSWTSPLFAAHRLLTA